MKKYEEEKFSRKKINRNKSPQNNSNDDGSGDGVGFVEALQKYSPLIMYEMLSEKGTRAWNKLRNLYFMTH
jgi:hypothetical protein